MVLNSHKSKKTDASAVSLIVADLKPYKHIRVFECTISEIYARSTETESKKFAVGVK